jgi:hypothetical protein
LNCASKQRGTLRTADGTRAEIEEQIRTACYGVASNVEKLQTATGTKDKIAQYWIEILLQKAREKKTQPNPEKKSPKQLAEELYEWFKDQPGEKLNPLLLLQSDSHFFDVLYCQISDLVKFQASIPLRTLRLRSSTRFYWAS